jgi:DNA (cytosine-5)-methyltransferase 1
MGNGGPDDNDAQAGRLVSFHATQDPVHHHHHTPALSAEPSGNLAVSGTVRSHPRPGSNSDGNCVTFTSRGREDGAQTETQEDGLHPALRSGRGGGRRDSGVAGPEVGVRRLTPVECERLQGLPDGWTDIGDTPDSRRYSAVGDAVTANVSEWIGGRLAAAAGGESS